MEEWVVYINEKLNVFNDYHDALSVFLSAISKHLWENSLNNKSNNSPVYDCCCVPIIVGDFFGIRYDERTITDEEIIIRSRLSMLLDYFLSKDANNIKTNALKLIKHSFKYRSNNKDFCDNINIFVEMKLDEIVVEIITTESFFKTNAFLLDNKLGKYYFKTKQRIISSNDPKLLGETIELEVILEPFGGGKEMY